MQDARIFSACESEAAEVAAWLARRLKVAGKPASQADRVARKLETDWPRLVHLLFPRDCDTQMVMLSISGEDERLEVALVTETCGQFDPGVAEQAQASGLGALVRDEVEGLARLMIPLEVQARA